MRAIIAASVLVALIAAATALEINGKEAGGIWILIVLILLFADWLPDA